MQEVAVQLFFLAFLLLLEATKFVELADLFIEGVLSVSDCLVDLINDAVEISAGQLIDLMLKLVAHVVKLFAGAINLIKKVFLALFAQLLEQQVIPALPHLIVLLRLLLELISHLLETLGQVGIESGDVADWTKQVGLHVHVFSSFLEGVLRTLSGNISISELSGKPVDLIGKAGLLDLLIVGLETL